ncbi:MAG TPA: hypothetical protein VK797_11340 [Tepidisphaeraceae bacterium]|jgi:hypothetical protein|nr:hypothetical protein [Tepidisphaeraceae bacterium]
MRERRITVPELGMIAGTRALLGAGVGLLVADRLAPETRRAVGWTLIAIGAISTIPLAAEVLLRDDQSPVRTGDVARRPEPSPAL